MQAGLIKGDIDGATVCYCIDEKAWKIAKERLNQFFNSFKETGGCC